MSIETHVRAGGAWRDIQEIHVKDGGVWRDIQEAWVKVAGVWQQVFDARSYPVFDTLCSADWVNALACFTQLELNTDGTITEQHTIGASGSLSPLVTNWTLPTLAGIGNTHWVRGTLISGDAPTSGDTLGVWLALSSQRQWLYNSGTGGATSTRTGVIQFQIATDAAGVGIVSTSSVTFLAERDT